jgi:hypothetical protein
MIKTPLEFLQAVYCNPNIPLSVRMKAACEAAKYSHHKPGSLWDARRAREEFEPDIEATPEEIRQACSGPLLPLHERAEILAEAARMVPKPNRLIPPAEPQPDVNGRAVLKPAKAGLAGQGMGRRS